MARGGGPPGGGRSMGGGGGRSFGGRSGGSGFNRGGVSSGPSYNRRSSSPGFGNTPVGGGRNSGLGPALLGYGLGRGSARRPARQGGMGCLGVVLTIVVIVVILMLVLSTCSQNTAGSSTQITASTIAREALPKGAVNETDYYTDELGWIGNSATLTTGMKNFYQETGVQPYLYLTDTIGGSHNPGETQVAQFANDTYDALFTDEAHLLVIFLEYNNQYHTWYLGGSQAKTVLDNEAMNILLDYIDRYYYDQTLTDEQMFSKAFNDAGKRIMEVTTSPWIPVLIVIGILAILAVAFLWWRNHKKQQNIEAAQTQRILETPLETFGDTDAEERAKKYDEE